MNHTPLEAARTYTRGLNFPASKEQVLDVVQRNGAPRDLVDIIHARPITKFASPADLMVILRQEGPRGSGAAGW